MADNIVYITAGLPVSKNSAQTPDQNTVYITAGLPAEVEAVGLGGVSVGGSAATTFFNTEEVEGGSSVSGHAAIILDAANVNIIPISAPLAQPNRKPNCRINTASKQFNGLIAWWNCDYPNGDFLYDPIGGHTATLSGALAEDTWVIDAERAYVPQFDGTNNYFSAPDSPTLELTGTFTISFWLDSTEPLEKIILEKDGFGGFSVRTIGISGSSEIELTVGGDGNTIVTENNWTDGDGWHLITFVYRGINDAVVYVDGIIDTDSSAGVTVGTPSYGSGPLYIGGNVTDSLDGKVDDIRIYNRELTQTEVQQLYHPQTRYELWFKEPEPVLFKFTEVIYNETMDGGVEVGGIAEENFNDIIEVSGGIEVGGSATITLFDIAEVGGGVEVSGFAIVVRIPAGNEVYNETMDDGVVVNGASVNNSISEEQGKGGVVVDGITIDRYTATATLEGGVEISGSATITLFDIIEVGGGVEISGSATITLFDIIEVGGGVEIGGSATTTLFDIVEVSGGVEVSGFAIVVRIPAGYNETMDDGVVVNGASVNNSISEEQGKGGVVVDGTTIDRYTATATSEGGVEIGGSTTATTLFDIIEVSGGVEVGGSATTTLFDIVEVSGGVEVSGSATTTLFDIVEVSGGVLINGSGSVSGQMTYFPDGGVVVNGASPFGNAYTDIPYGGVVVGGEPNTEWIAWPRTEGGVLVDGEVIEDSTFNTIIDGGVLVAGGGSQIDEIMDGGVDVGGRILILHPVDALGGVKVGGNGSISIIFVPEGGVVISPIPGEEFKPNICPCIIQSRVLSLNELNFLDQRIFVKELQDRTERKALVWKSLETLVRFKSTELPFDYHLTQMGTEVILDVSKEDNFFGSFSSSIHPEIQDIFDYVSFTLKGDRSLKNTMDLIWDMERCP